MASNSGRGISYPGSIVVNVRFTDQQNSYELKKCSTVKELRQRLASDYNAQVSEVKILLGGVILDDCLTIEESGVGMESMLFAIRQMPPSELTQPSELTLPLQLSPHTLASAQHTQKQRATVFPQNDMATSTDLECRTLIDQYFVYCKLCGEVKPGRLRVKCSICGDGGVLLHKDPNGWEDVLISGRLEGSCQSLHCVDCVPVNLDIVLFSAGTHPHILQTSRVVETLANEFSTSGSVVDHCPHRVFYFKCIEQHPGKIEGTVVALPHIRPNRRCVDCITCAEQLTPVVVFPCLACHVMCLDCFKTYCTVRLHERQFVESQTYGYTLPCPGCEDSFIQEQHHFCIMGREEYERYKDLAAEECMLAEGGLYCPQQNCGMGFVVETKGTCVICPRCKFVFCRNCRGAAHKGECTSLTQGTEFSRNFSNPQQAERAMWERQTAKTIEQTTKACPGCATRTERNGGCMHLVCSRCKMEWCWLCVKSWDRQCQAAHWFD